MKGIIPRQEGAVGIKEGTVRDIAVISRVNRPVCFVVTGFERDENGTLTAVLSRAQAQKRCIEQYISHLVPGDVIDARITHLETFGAFADIGCGVVSLMPIDTISVSRIEHPGERFLVEMDIKAVVKMVENGRISLSHKELLGTWEENAAQFQEGIHPGQQASVYIKNIIPQRMKIKLIVIDTFEYAYKPKQPNYFYHGKHIDRFLYSPASSEKVIESVFTPEKASV